MLPIYRLPITHRFITCVLSEHLQTFNQNAGPNQSKHAVNRIKINVSKYMVRNHQRQYSRNEKYSILMVVLHRKQIIIKLTNDKN